MSKLSSIYFCFFSYRDFLSSLLDKLSDWSNLHSTQKKEKKSSTAGFEPAQAKPNRFRVCLLNHSDISTYVICFHNIIIISLIIVEYTSHWIMRTFRSRQAGFSWTADRSEASEPKIHRHIPYVCLAPYQRRAKGLDPLTLLYLMIN
jgi:hypothetical protein